MRIDLHAHTIYSPDSLLRLEELIHRAEKAKIDCVAITDHNTIVGAYELIKMRPSFKVIIGAEISTREGEIIGLFLKEQIPSGLGVMETIKMIKEQHGLIILPHPCDRLRHHVLDQALWESVIPQVDLVEGFNGRTVFRGDDLKAMRLASKYGKPFSAGSDAHTKWEFGCCGMEILGVTNFENQEQLILAIKNGKIFGCRTQPWNHVITKTVKILNHVGFRKYERMY